MNKRQVGSYGIVGFCKYCNKPFIVGNAQFGFRRNYCSGKCIKSRWRKDNLEKHNTINTKWRETNPNYFKDYWLKNEDKLREFKRNYYIKNRKKLLKESSERKSKKRQLRIANGEVELDKHMLGKTAVQKGKLLENFIVEKLRESKVDIHARRTKGSGGYLERGDIWNDLGLNIECKNQKTFQFNKFWSQTLKDSEMTHTIPVLIWHPPNVPLEKSSVTITLDYFLELILKNQEPKIKQMDRELRWKLQKLIDVTKSVIKELE